MTIIKCKRPCKNSKNGICQLKEMTIWIGKHSNSCSEDELPHNEWVAWYKKQEKDAK